MDTYYVYRHIRLDSNTPFYVGKGKGRRAWDLTNRNDYHKRITEKHGCRIEIIMDNLTEKKAFAKETEFIKLYKSLGYKGEKPTADLSLNIRRFSSMPKQSKQAILYQEIIEKLNSLQTDVAVLKSDVGYIKEDVDRNTADLETHIEGVRVQSARLDNEIARRQAGNDGFSVQIKTNNDLIHEIKLSLKSLEKIPQFFDSIKKVAAWITVLGGAFIVITKILGMW